MRYAGLANLYPEYHHCRDFVDCLMQHVYYDGSEGEGPEIVHDNDRAGWYIPEDDPDREASIQYLQDNFDELYDQAFEMAHDEVRAEVQRLADQWTEKVRAAAIKVADAKGLDPDVVVDLVLSDLISLYLEEGGAGSGTWDKDEGVWAELKDIGITGEDILAAMQRGYDQTLDDQLLEATSIVMHQAGRLATDTPYTTASVRRTAGSNELEEFLADKAWDAVKEYIKEYDPQRFRSDVEQTLNEHPEMVDALRQHGMTPRLFLNNVDEFYQYLQGGVWEDQHGYVDIDYARINQFVSTFESEWAATISGVLSNLDVAPERADEILNTLTNDPYVLHAYYCDEGWSCDWVDDILAVFGDLSVTEEDLGLSGNSDAGTMAYTDASWLGVQKLLARLLEEYLDRELEQAVPNYHDWRQTRMPV